MRYENMTPGELIRAAENAATTGLELALLEALKDPGDPDTFVCGNCEEIEDELDAVRQDLHKAERHKQKLHEKLEGKAVVDRSELRALCSQVLNKNYEDARKRARQVMAMTAEETANNE